MRKIKKFKLLPLVLAVFMLAGVFAGCDSDSKSSKSSKSSDEKASSVSKETVFEYYNKVEIGMTKEKVDSALGVSGKSSSQLEGLFLYTNEKTSYGVSVLFDDKNSVMAKTLLYPDREDIAPLCTKKFTQEQSDSIKNGMSYDDVKKLVGEDGIEINQTQIPFDDDKVSKIFVWVNNNDSLLQVTFGTDGKSNSSMFFD